MKKDFIVLSLYEVHMASAAIMVNGEVLAAAHEERFSRIKNDCSFPLKAARFCLQQAGIKPEDVDVVVMLNEKFPPSAMVNILFKRQTLFSVEDWIYENEHYWKLKLVEKKNTKSYFEIMGGWDRVQQHYYDLSKLDMNAPEEVVAEVFNQIRKDAVEKHLNIPKERVMFAPHYLCHHYHAYYSGKTRGRDVAIMHMEGDGGKYNSAVSIPSAKGLQIIGGSNQSDLGRLYQWTTLLLGMRPYHHEYKLMGLAPYATEYEVKRSFKILEPIFKLDEKSLAIVYNHKPSDLYFHFLKNFQGHRFDGIAGALQLLLEKWLIEWAKLVLNKTGAKRLCYGGGVAMNVKANMLLSQLEGLDYLCVPISPADESNVFGAGYWVTEQHLLRNNANPEAIPPLKTPYLGYQYSREEIFKALKANKVRDKFFTYEGVEKEQISQLLAQGDTVAVCKGRAEFGQRALGNRSILAHPSRSDMVNKINKQIKYRDFWMPFCPTILTEDQRIYLYNPKNLESDYMTVAFPVKKSYLASLQAVIHPGDATARPQILKKEDNPDYYGLIKDFKSQTGIGALLNTSFNLHGEPMVNTPHDALGTFFRSELDALWMEDVLISRRPLQIDTRVPNRLNTVVKRT